MQFSEAELHLDHKSSRRNVGLVTAVTLTASHI